MCAELDCRAKEMAGSISSNATWHGSIAAVTTTKAVTYRRDAAPQSEHHAFILSSTVFGGAPNTSSIKGQRTDRSIAIRAVGLLAEAGQYSVHAKMRYLERHAMILRAASCRRANDVATRRHQQSLSGRAGIEAIGAASAFAETVQGRHCASGLEAEYNAT
jgi:hypothetical protein